MEQAIFPALLSFWITMFLYIADSNILAIYSYRQSGGNTVSHSYHLPSMYCLCVIKNCQLSLRGLVVSLLWQSMFSHFPTCVCIFTVLPAASRCIEYLINISVYIYVCVCLCVCMDKSVKFMQSFTPRNRSIYPERYPAHVQLWVASIDVSS